MPPLPLVTWRDLGFFLREPPLLLLVFLLGAISKTFGLASPRNTKDVSHPTKGDDRCTPPHRPTESKTLTKCSAMQNYNRRNGPTAAELVVLHLRAF